MKIKSLMILFVFYPLYGYGRTIKVVVESLASQSTHMNGNVVAGARLAVDEFRDEFKRLGYSIELVNVAPSAENVADTAKTLAKDPEVFGIVDNLGPRAMVAARVYAQQNLAMVLPLNTLSDLGEKPLENVFRMGGRNDGELSIALGLVRNLHAQRIFVLQSDSSKWRRKAVDYLAEIKGMGLNVLQDTSPGLTPGKDFRSILLKIESFHPDLIYASMPTAELGPITRRLREGGFYKPIFSAEMLDNDDYEEVIFGLKTLMSPYIFYAGIGNAANSYYVSPYGRIEDYKPSSDQQSVLLKRHKGMLYRFGIHSYDSMRVLLTAIRLELPETAKTPFHRKAVIARMHHHAFDGITGRISFNANGDRSEFTYFLYKYVPERNSVDTSIQDKFVIKR